MPNFINQKSSLCPTNGRQTVGDGAVFIDNEPSVLAVCHLQGKDDNMYYYSTTFSGGPGVSPTSLPSRPALTGISSGVFDVPKAKCPPDRGSSDCVRDSLAPTNAKYTPNSLSSSPSSLSFSKSHYHPSPAIPISAVNHAHSNPGRSMPRVIPSRNNSDISTPPLTPDSGSDYSSSGSISGSTTDSVNSQDALDFLMTLFPNHGLKALPYAKRVSISTPNLGADFDGVVLELPGKLKTLYVDGKGAAAVNLRESIVALLDLADESLGCNALVIALERSSPDLSNLLHSLMYVGGTVVTKPSFPVASAFVLVGLEI